MSKVLSSFANTTGDLKSLDDEYIGLVRFFNKPEIKAKVDFEPHLNEDLDTLTSTILDAKKDMRVFHFSGHSKESGLDFPGSEFDSGHVVRFFNTLNQEENNLQCMFINGCENAGIIRKLGHVPVVIGTRSKIQDSVAQKFTQDFFTSLIAGESSYRQAFLDALAARELPDYRVYEPLRGEGAFAQLRKDEPLNQYFMIVNDGEVANSKFPFRKKPANFARYIFILLLLVALVLGFLYRDQLIGMVRGFTCPEWIDDDNCRLLVADFNCETGLDVNELIAEGIDSNEEINPYLEVKYATEFKEYTGESSGGEDLHKLCNYDFTLTGGILKRQSGQYKMDLVLYSDYPDFQDEESQTMEIGDLVELEEMVQTVNLDNSDHFLINRICIACAQKRPELIDYLDHQLIVYRKSMTSPESYQNLNVEMFALHKQREDVPRMLEALHNIADVGRNDYVLGAIERAVRLNMEVGMVPEAFENQSRYISETGMRIESPRSFQMGKPLAVYRQNQLKMRLVRGRHVLAHPGMLREHLRTALMDFRILHEAGYQGRSYLEEIRRLQALINGGEEEEPDEQAVELTGQVLNENGQPLQGVRIRMEEIVRITDDAGRFSLGSFPAGEIAGKAVSAVKDGYQGLRFRIRDAGDLLELHLRPVAETPAKKQYTIRGEVRDCGREGTIMKEVFIGGKPVELEKSTYTAVLEAAQGTEVEITLPDGFSFNDGKRHTVLLGEGNRYSETLDVVSEPGLFSISGRVLVSNDPIEGAALRIDGQGEAATTDQEGNFGFRAEVTTCTRLHVTAPGYRPKEIWLRDFMRGRRMNLGNIDLDAASPVPGADRPPGPDVILQTINLSSREYKMMFSALQEAGYAVSEESKNMKEPPEGFPESAIVQYVGEGYADDAKEVAKLMTSVMKVKFGTGEFELPRRFEAARLERRQQQNLILVRYFPNRRID